MKKDIDIKKRIKVVLSIFLLTFSFLTIYYLTTVVFAWSGPSEGPPGGNIDLVGIVRNRFNMVEESVSGNVEIDLSEGSVFKHTLTGNVTYTGIIGYSVGKQNSFRVIINQSSTIKHNITWPNSVIWKDNHKPSDLRVGTNALYDFVSFDDGSTWYATPFHAELTTCPVGMIPVPADGVNPAFCVDKYEAKNVDGKARSLASGTPWADIDQNAARAACVAVGKRLISNDEWLQIARNVENVGWNWSGGSVGSGNMSDGHSDNSPGNSLAAGSDDDPCYGTGNSCSTTVWHNQRRTYKLSNGEYIWDFGGNVWQWIDETVQNHVLGSNGSSFPNDWSAWSSCSSPSDSRCGNTIATNDGRHGGNTVDLRGFRRGGYWDSGPYAGPFSLILMYSPVTPNAFIGFRCVR